MAIHPSRFQEHFRRAHQVHDGVTLASGTLPRPFAKKYDRMTTRSLVPNTLHVSLQDVLDRRLSARPHASGPLTWQQVSTILSASARVRADAHRPYPGAGDLYSVQIYLLGSIEGESYAYYYDAIHNALVTLWKIEQRVVDAILAGENAERAQLIMVLTANWPRLTPEYGSFAFPLAHLEAGHVGQNIALTALAVEADTRMQGGFNDQLIMDTLDLSPEEEQPLAVIALSGRHVQDASQVSL